MEKKLDHHHNPQLPEEIIIEIFTKLPTKSVGRCRCLSKSWRSRLSGPQFINQHLTATLKSNQPHNLILISYFPEETDRLCLIAPLTKDVIAAEYELPNSNAVIRGSCNGLVVLTMSLGRYDTPDLFLINPTVQRKLQLQLPGSPSPQLGFDYNRKWVTLSYGFGYDSVTDDYKIVQLSYFCRGAEKAPCVLVVEVYYVKSGVWKRIGSSLQDHSYWLSSDGVFVNGALHWLYIPRRDLRSSYVIVVFDLTSEVFSEIDVPDNLTHGRFQRCRCRTFVLGGCLCVVNFFSGYIRVWMMEEYGRVDSWTTFSMEEVWGLAKPLCFTGDSEVVLFTAENKVFIYDMQNNASKLMSVYGGLSCCFTSGHALVESLIRPVQIEAEQMLYRQRQIKVRRGRQIPL